SEEKRGQYLEFIQRSVREMDRLVRDLLDVSSMESGNFTVDRQPVDVRAVLREVCEIFDMTAREGNIALDVDVDPAIGTVRADRDRLSQLVSNLLSNALKFTPAGGRVTLRAIRHDGEVEIV